MIKLEDLPARERLDAFPECLAGGFLESDKSHTQQVNLTQRAWHLWKNSDFYESKSDSITTPNRNDELSWTLGVIHCFLHEKCASYPI